METALATLTGWGRVARASSVTLKPAELVELGGVFADPRPRAHGLIAHGAGRSYGDAALNAQGSAVLTSSLDRILAFDQESGIVQAEPGVTFNHLLERFLPQGFLAPVTPGTGYATLGGAVAHDVHGKNHEAAGCFSRHVIELDLLCPDGTHRTIGPDREAELFHATAGGLGLTGLITRIAFRLQRVPGGAVMVREQRVADLDAFLEAMDAARDASYAVGWIDGIAQGRALGRGILETAEPSAEPARPRRQKRLRIPFDLPGFVLNPLSVGLLNAAYYRHVPMAGRRRAMPWSDFLYPLDAIQGWNRVYGHRGFHQFQNVVPFARGRAALVELLGVIAATRRASFLAVLKRLGESPVAGPLAFPQPGYTLALDFPAGPGIEELYARLTAITLCHGGRVYLAKDALLTERAFRCMYPRWTEFRDVLDLVDPTCRLQSDMSRRLGIRKAA